MGIAATFPQGKSNVTKRTTIFMQLPPMLTPPELRELASAKERLETPGLTARLTGIIGKPVEQGFKLLPKGWQNTVNKATRAALLSALRAAVATLGPKKEGAAASERFHQIMAGASGGLGGFFGFASLPVELPISTTLMLRSIADVARSEGHDLRAPETKLACLEVFALGGKSDVDDSAEGAYWAVRTALAKAVSEATAYLAEKTAIERSSPALLRLVTAIAARFGVIVSEQAAAKAVPIVGAVGGAAINILFMDHFQSMARGHFIVKRLETKYGSGLVRQVYESLAIRDPVR